MRVTSLSGTPLLCRICQAMSLSTESKALVRSNMHKKIVLRLLYADSQSSRKLKRASVQLRSGLKPYCCSRSWSPRC